jgi:histidinol-phosphatase (PHP family)
MIRAGGLDVLGHVDLVRKNNPRELWFSQTGPSYQNRITSLSELLAGRRDIVVEVNTGGLNRKTAADTYPSLPFLRLLCERDIALTITADAHRAEDLDGHYLFARENLLNSGCRETLIFRGREEGRPIWRKKALLPD